MLAGLTFNLRLTLRVCTGLPASVTVKVSGVLAAAVVGVPEITPLVALSARPAGSAPVVRAQDKGGVPPVAVSVVLYERPIWPFGSEVVLIWSVEAGGELVVPESPPPPEQLHSSRAGAKISAGGALRRRDVLSNFK
jgi:hypothetical protein